MRDVKLIAPFGFLLAATLVAAACPTEAHAQADQPAPFTGKLCIDAEVVPERLPIMTGEHLGRNIESIVERHLLQTIGAGPEVVSQRVFAVSLVCNVYEGDALLSVYINPPNTLAQTPVSMALTFGGQMRTHHFVSENPPQGTEFKYVLEPSCLDVECPIGMARSYTYALDRIADVTISWLGF